jgi:hypothetical protein
MIDAVSGEPPFGMQADEEVCMSKLNGELIERPDDMFGDAKWELIARMTASDSQERPTLEELIADMDQLDRERREGSASNRINEQCVQCGSRMPKTYQFCGNCGAKLRIVEIADAEAVAA